MKDRMHGAPSTDRTGPRRWLRGLAMLMLLLISALVVVDTALWFRFQHVLDRRIEAFTAKAATAGWSMRAETVHRGGWPVTATLTLRGPHLEGAGRFWPGGLGWNGDEMELSLSPLHPKLLHVILRGTQSFHVGALSLKGWGATLALQSEADRIVLMADALHLARAGAGPDDILQIAGVLGELHWRPNQPGGTDLSVTLRALALPLPSGDTGGRVVQRARLTMSLEGTLPNDNTSWPAAFAQWRAQGGAIRLNEASLDWGDAGASLSGRAAPRDNGALDGDFTLDLTHPELALETLQRGGVIGSGQRRAIAAVIGLIAAGGAPAGADPQIHLPLELRHDALLLGSIPLLTLPLP